MTIVPLTQPLVPLPQPFSQSPAPASTQLPQSFSEPRQQSQSLAAPEADSGVPAPDGALPASEPAGRSFGATLLDALDAAGGALARADAAERAFSNGRGGLQEMVLERAQADVVLSIASAAASRTAQALTTLLGMQV
jgi:flagellar hook-basal body complex protein FliE